MQIKHHIYSVNYCSLVVPKELWEDLEVPEELKNYAVDEYSRLKDGIEVPQDSLYEFINNSPEFNEIHPKWQEFLKEVLKIEVDAYIFHN